MLELSLTNKRMNRCTSLAVQMLLFLCYTSINVAAYCVVNEIPNGIISTRNVTEGQQVHYSCLSGFVLIGNEFRTCQNGVLDGAEPTCAFPCTVTPPFNGNVSSTTVSHGHNVTFTCNQGFTLTGSSQLTCNNGTLNAFEPICSPILPPCSVETPVNGNVSSTSVSSGHNVTFTCYQGYSLTGSSLLTCYNGSLSAPEPKCSPVNCGTPPYDVVAMESPSFAHTTYDAIAYYTCKDGYNTTANPTSQCLANGTWSAPPICSPVNCGMPPDGINTMLPPSYTNLTYGAIAYYTCKIGYSTTEQLTAQCRSDGTWSSAPNCKVCPSNTYGLNCTGTCMCTSNYTVFCDHVTGACNCTRQWKGDFCEIDVDECAEDTHTCRGQNEGCHNTPGGFTCSCNEGYIRDSNNDLCVQSAYKCEDPGFNTCEQECVNINGSFSCSCLTGYIRNDIDPTKCDDVDECLDGASGCEQDCQNTDGSFSCACNEGYTLTVDRKTCRKIQGQQVKLDMNLTIGIAIPSSVNLQEPETQLKYRKDLQEQLQQIYDPDGSNGALVTVTNVKRGSLKVDFSITADDASVSNVVSVNAELAKGVEFTVDGFSGTSLSLSIDGQTVTKDTGSSGDQSLCQAFLLSGQCNKDEICVVIGDKPVCKKIPNRDSSLILPLALGLGIPLAFLFGMIFSIVATHLVRLIRESGGKEGEKEETAGSSKQENPSDVDINMTTVPSP